MEDRFKNRKAAHDWLIENQYSISRGKFYDDCAKGVVVVSDDKSLSRFQVLQYALAQQQRISNPTGMDIGGAAEADLRKKVADAEIAERKAKKLAREEDELWLHAADAWAAIAGVVHKMRGAVRHQIYSARREIVQTGAGNQDRVDEVYQLLESLVDVAFNEVAGQDIEIDF